MKAEAQFVTGRGLHVHRPFRPNYGNLFRPSGKEKEAIADYELDLLTARNANAVPPGPELGPALVAADASLDYEADSGDEIPRLPRAESSDEQGPHREKNDWHPPCCIARKLSKKEMTTDIKAKAALDAEWEQLRFLKRPHPTPGVGAWDEGNVREAASIRLVAQAAGKAVHFSRIVEPCHEKGSELAVGDPNRKMKGRAVLLGDNVKDQDFSWAEFCELGSSPPSIEAAKALDAMGSMPGYLVKMAMLSVHSPKPCCLAPKLGLAFPRTVGQNIGGANSHGQWFG